MFKFFLLLFCIPLYLVALSLEEARHLMGRAAFGIDQKTFLILKDKSKKEAVDWLFESAKKEDLRELPSWHDKPMVRKIPLRKMTSSQRKAYQKERKKREKELKAWWLGSMLETQNPLREKMTLFWHNHFTSSVKKVRSSIFMLEQNQLLREHALGNFGTLLHKISKDPAMVIYLDNQNNKKQNPNENYAREVMELFTLGEGHYSEKDIKEAARAFSGWRVNRKKGEFIFVKKMHDFGEKEFLGERGNFGGSDILNTILKQKRTATYVTEKFYTEFISEDLNDKEIERISAIFYDSNYDISKLLREILLSDDFWDINNRGVLVKSPVELIIGTLRSLEMVPKNIKSLVVTSKRLRQDIFNPPNVKGWNGGTYWLDSNSILLRNQIISRIVRGKGKKLDMIMHMSNGIFQGDDIDSFMRYYFLALPPITDIDYSKSKKSVISSLLLDPIYQLK